jgi:hypothetical protein
MMMHKTVVSTLLLIALLSQTIAADSYKDVKLMVNAGDKSETTDAVLRFEADRLVVQSKKGAELKSLPYASIRSAEYSYSKSPRWKSALGLSVHTVWAAGFLLSDDDRVLALFHVDMGKAEHGCNVHAYHAAVETKYPVATVKRVRAFA